jgi:hypothetical protein
MLPEERMTARTGLPKEHPVHIFTGRNQPLVRYRDVSFGMMVPRKWTKTNPRRLYWCRNCGRRRWAAKLSIQIHYDCSYIFCTDKDDCKAQKRRRRP